MKLHNKETNKDYNVTTEDGNESMFRIFAVPVDGGHDSFVMGYRSLEEFCDEWEDAD